MAKLTANELYYLNSILVMLRQNQQLACGPSMYTEVLGDNIDWLDNYIEQGAKDDSQKA